MMPLSARWVNGAAEVPMFLACTVSPDAGQVIVMFDPLTLEDLTHIVEIQLARVARRLADRRITLEVSDAGKAWLASTGFDPVYGARPLKRLIQTTIEDALARRLLAGEVHDGDAVAFDVDAAGSGLVVVA